MWQSPGRAPLELGRLPREAFFFFSREAFATLFIGVNAMSTYCQATTRDGRPCRAHHVRGSLYCFWHEPAHESARKLASHKGGLATLEDMQQRKREREERLRIFTRLEQALATARRLYGFNK
jgi:hypothetical protein